MNSYRLVNWSTGDVLEILALHWEIENYQHTFYLDVEGKIIQQSFTTRYWDIRNIEYDTTTSRAK